MCRIAKKNACLILNRAKAGQEKYGTDLLGNPLSRAEWLKHALEETLDKANYISRLIEPIQVINEDTCGNCRNSNIKSSFTYCPDCGAVLKF